MSLSCSLCFFFRNNEISNLQEVAKLQVLPMLQALVLLDNPCSDEPNYRLEVLVLLPHLQRLDKELFEQDERVEANKIRQKRQEEEKVRTAWWGKEKEVKGKRIKHADQASPLDYMRRRLREVGPKGRGACNRGRASQPGCDGRHHNPTAIPDPTSTTEW